MGDEGDKKEEEDKGDRRKKWFSFVLHRASFYKFLCITADPRHNGVLFGVIQCWAG
jgi:hypothetical protein